MKNNFELIPLNSVLDFNVQTWIGVFSKIKKQMLGCLPPHLLLLSGSIRQRLMLPSMMVLNLI